MNFSHVRLAPRRRLSRRSPAARDHETRQAGTATSGDGIRAPGNVSRAALVVYDALEVGPNPRPDDLVTASLGKSFANQRLRLGEVVVLRSSGDRNASLSLVVRDSLHGRAWEGP